MSGDPGVDSSDAQFASGYFGRIRQAKRLIVESNVLEMGIPTYPATSDNGRACAIYMYGDNIFSPVYTYPGTIIRGNIFRNVNDAVVPRTRAISVGGCEHIALENNISGLDRAQPIEHNHCLEVHTFNNLYSTGGVIISNPSDGVPAAEVSTEVHADLDDAIVSWFLDL